MANRSGASSEIVARVRRLGQAIDADMPIGDAAGMWGYITRKLNTSAECFAQAGLGLIDLKHHLPHGEFTSERERRHVPQQLASEAMRVAKLLLALPAPKQRKLLAQFSRSHLTELARIDPEFVEEVIDGEQLDDLAVMSVRELREEVRKVRGRLAHADKARAAAQTELRDAQTVRRAEAGSEYPEAVVRARMESAALADEAAACVHSLLAHFRALLDVKTDLGPRNQKRENLRAGVGAVWAQLCGHAAQVDAALQEVEGVPPEYIPTAPEQMPTPLAASEGRRLAAAHARALRRLRDRAEAREVARVDRGQLKRGRGRPAKAKVAAPKRARGRPKGS